LTNQESSYLRSKVDLHVHTTASDGVHTPEQVVEIAIRSGLQVMGLTDHDTTQGIPAALRAAHGSTLQVWPGVEISTDFNRGEVHLLGYFIDYTNEHLQSVLRTMRESRLERAFHMVQKLAQLNVPVDWPRVLELAAHGNGTVGRPHIATAMLEKGYVSSIGEAFQRYIGRDGPAYVERVKLSSIEAIKLVDASGGLAVLAHPLDSGNRDHGSPPDLDATLSRLAEVGLAGLEVFYPNYDKDSIQYLLSLARRWNLVPTGGSDYHGRDSTAIGQINVPYESAQRLFDLHLAKKAGARS
jgi:predicted metal-dependent phosphoesterase TrpH